VDRRELCNLYVLDHAHQHVHLVSDVFLGRERVYAALRRPPAYETADFASWADVTLEELDTLRRSDPDLAPSEDEVRAALGDGVDRSLCLTFRGRRTDGE
jgi:hypothetical protein